jgi:hypothetical protein
LSNKGGVNMNAKEARKKAQQSAIKKPQLADIKRLIEIAVMNGEYHCWYYDKVISEEVRKELKSDGYKVGKLISDRNELLTQISW